VTLTPTDEQRAITDAYLAGKNLVIEAGASTGKTSTLRLLASAAPDRRGVYVAYNRAIADDAKRSFPPNVTCATAHSLAFRAVGRSFAHRLRAPRMPAREVARQLGITRPIPLDRGNVLAPAQAARIATDAVARFCHSAAAELGTQHVPAVPGLDEPKVTAALQAAVLPLARQAWADLSRPDGHLRFAHDHYLKLWQLSGPRLEGDVVLLDEAQDANPVIASVVDRQHHAQRILVGDRCQAIYGWRGAIDAMASFNADQRLALSQSFRFGPAIADEANKWLGLLGAPLRLRGFERVASTVAPLDHPAAVLCRTNAEAVTQLMAAADQGRRAALVGGANDIRRLAEAAVSLRAGQPTDHPELFAFKSWGEVQDYAAQDTGGSDLKVMVLLIDRHGPELVIETMDRLVPESSAELVVSTAHKAKGREWPTVRIAADFREPKGEQASVPRSEAMLAYVAVTRARQVLDKDGLAWLDRYLVDRGSITITTDTPGPAITIDAPGPAPATDAPAEQGNANGPTPKPDDEAGREVAASAVVAALERTWAAIRAHHPELPEAVVILGPGSEARRGLVELGHFAAGRWHLPADKANRHEVLVAGEGLRRGPSDVLDTLLHEAAHGLAHARQVKDTSRQGRWHNQRYAALAREAGLEVTADAKTGMSQTHLTQQAAARYAKQLRDLEAALGLWRHAEPTREREPGSRGLLACSCACGRKLRVARSTLEQAPILCGACEQPFEPAERELTRHCQPAERALTRARQRARERDREAGDER
jgi:AAA domain